MSVTYGLGGVPSSVTRGWGGVEFSRKKRSITLEWPLMFTSCALGPCHVFMHCS